MTQTGRDQVSGDRAKPTTLETWAWVLGLIPMLVAIAFLYHRVPGGRAIFTGFFMVFGLTTALTVHYRIEPLWSRFERWPRYEMSDKDWRFARNAGALCFVVSGWGFVTEIF